MLQTRDKITKGWKEWERHDGNPFRDEMIVTPSSITRKSKDPNRVMLVKDTGQEKSITFSYTEFRESDAFVKIFKENIKRMFNLSKTAMKLFWYASTELVINNEVVCITMDEAMDFCEFKGRKSYFDGMSELLDRGIIAKTDRDDYYFVNAAIFFSGSRMKITTLFVKPKRKELEDDEL